MNILAIDLSTSAGRVACLQDEDLLVAADVPPSQRSAAVLFETLEAARNKAGWSRWTNVDLYAAGRGPGRYSGMRVALTAVQHLALPGNNPVRAIDSGAALAAEWAANTPDTSSIWVLGDARRERVWRGVFDRTPRGHMQQTDDWSLLPIATCIDHFQQLRDTNSPLLISSEWDRLLPHLAEHGWSESASTLKRIDASPSAAWIGRLAYREQRSNQSPAPPVPIYLHPAVATQPK